MMPGRPLIELRALPSVGRCRYERVAGQWRLSPVEAPSSFMLDAEGVAPPMLCMLAPAAADGEATALQVRVPVNELPIRAGSPLVEWIDEAGMTVWHGAQAAAASVGVHTLAAGEPPSPIGAVLVAETTPAVHLLRLADVLPEPITLLMCAWPAEQWLMAWHRAEAVAALWPLKEHEQAHVSTTGFAGDPAGSAAKARPGTSVRIERNGRPQAGQTWQRAFTQGLDRGLEMKLGALFDSFSSLARTPSMRAAVSLLTGHCDMAWGWHDSARGMSARPFMRVIGDIDLLCTVDLSLEGDIEVGRATNRVRLSARGSSRLRFGIERDSDKPSLHDTIGAVAIALRVPFRIEHDAVAGPSAAFWLPAGPVAGEVVVEAGLRPRQVGSGWQWFARAVVEAVSVPVRSIDPLLLEESVSQLALLPAMSLADWSAG